MKKKTDEAINSINNEIDKEKTAFIIDLDDEVTTLESTLTAKVEEFYNELKATNATTIKNEAVGV